MYCWNIILILTLFSCSGDDNASDQNSKINPPSSSHGRWKALSDDFEFIISRNNVIEKAGIYNDPPYAATPVFDFKQLFDKEGYSIEEVVTPDSYEIRITNSSNSYELVNDTFFTLPTNRYFLLRTDGKIVMKGPGYLDMILERVE